MLQVDACCFDEGFVTFGCVFKDHDKKIVIASSRKELIIIDSAIAEILATRWSLQLAKKLKVERILVQYDALNVVDCINSHCSIALIVLLLF